MGALAYRPRYPTARRVSRATPIRTQRDVSDRIGRVATWACHRALDTDQPAACTARRRRMGASSEALSSSEPSARRRRARGDFDGLRVARLFDALGGGASGVLSVRRVALARRGLPRPAIHDPARLRASLVLS